MSDEHIEKFLGLKRKKEDNSQNEQGKNTSPNKEGTQDQETSQNFFQRTAERVKEAFKGPTEATGAVTTSTVEANEKPQEQNNTPEDTQKESQEAVSPTTDPTTDNNVTEQEQNSGGKGSSEETPEESTEEEKEENNESEANANTTAQQGTAQGTLMPQDVPKTPQDYAKAFLNDLGAGAGLAGGVVQGADESMGVLVNLARGIMSGNPIGIGNTVANAVMQQAMALKPIKDSIGRSLGINERNGTIDQEAAGTLRGAQYYQQQRRLDKFNENMNNWLGSALGPNANSANLMDTMNNMTVDQLQDFALKYEQQFMAEKQRLYANAQNGRLDKIDQAMLDGYQRVGDTLKTVAHNKSREHHLLGAMASTQATLMDAQARQKKNEFNTAFADMRLQAFQDPTFNPATRELFRAVETQMKQTYQTGNGKPGSGKQYIIMDASGKPLLDANGHWQINKDMLDKSDWDRLRRNLESIQQNRPLGPEESELLDWVNDKIYGLGYTREQDKDQWDRANSRVDRQRSPIDRMMADRKYRHMFRDGDYDAFFLPTKEIGRDAMAKEAQNDIYSAQNAILKYNMKNKNSVNLMGDGWFEYLENLEAISNTRRLTPSEMAGLRAQNVAQMIEMDRAATRIANGIENSSDPDDMYVMSDLRMALDAVKRGRTLKMGDRFKPYHSGVRLGSEEDDFVRAYNAVVDRQIENYLNVNCPGVNSGEQYDKALDRAMKKYRPIVIGDETCRRIFGPTSPGVNDADVDLDEVDESVSPVSKSQGIDAEGLTFGELFPIVKSKLGLDDDATEGFIKNQMTNVGHIDTPQQLQEEMEKVSDTGFNPGPEQNSGPKSEYKRIGGAKYYTGRDTGRRKYRDIPEKMPTKAPPKIQPKKEGPMTENEAYLRNLVGNAYGGNNEGRALRSKYKAMFTDPNREMTNDDLTRMHIINQRYRELSGGKDIWDSIRGTEGAAAREYVANMDTDKRNRPIADQMAYLYFPDAGQQHGMYADMIRGALNSGVTLDAGQVRNTRSGTPQMKLEHVRDNYSKMYDKYKTYSGQYGADPVAKQALDRIWRNFTADLLPLYKPTETYVDSKDGQTKIKEMDTTLLPRLENRFREEMKKLGREVTDEDVATFMDFVNNKIQAYRNGDYTPAGNYWDRDYLSNTIRGLMDYGDANLKRSTYDYIVENRVKPGMTNFRQNGRVLGNILGKDMEELSHMTPGAVKNHVVNIAKRNFVDKDGVYRKDLVNQFRNELTRTWNELNNKVNYSSMEKYADEPEFKESMDRWNRYKSTIENILAGLENATGDKVEEKVYAISGTGGPVRHKKSFEERASSLWDVDDIDYPKDEFGRAVQTDADTTFTRRVMLPIIGDYVRNATAIKELPPEDQQAAADRYKDQLYNAISNVKDDMALKMMRAWLQATDEKISSFEMYDRQGFNYNRAWRTMSEEERRANGMYHEPRTAQHFGELYRYKNTIRFLRRLVEKETAKRRV